MIEYCIQPYSPNAHLFRIWMTIPRPTAAGQRLTMPAWIPGSYMIRDFARHLVTLRAHDDAGGPVAVEKLDKQTWSCAPLPGPLQLVYDIYAWELSVRTAHLDSSHAYFNGSSLFLQARDQEDPRCGVELLPPSESGYQDWRVATTLERDGAEPFGFGRYRADDYQELIDHPVEMGRFSQARFELRGVPHDIVVTGRHRGDLARLCRDLPAICEQQVKLFGELPVDRYLFMVTAVGEGYGGLEHRRSTSLLCSRDDLPRVGEEGVGEGYRRFLGLCSHEYFHLWNVKRIRPKVFAEGGLETEVYTRQLWVFEGITSYYDDLALVRSGCIDAPAYLQLLAETMTRLMRGSGRHKQTLEESSFDAWTKFYQQDENAPNAIVSYYTKGALVALALDLKIRLGSAGQRSLDDLMRALWVGYGRTGEGVPEGAVERLAGEISGLDLVGFFEQALRGVEDLPLEELLAAFGVGLRLRTALGPEDRGGVAKTSERNQAPAGLVLGARWAGDEDAVRLTQVFDDGAAQQAGLAAGDRILAVDGLRVSAKNLQQRIAAMVPGETVSVHAFRRDELMRFELQPQPAPLDTCELYLLPDPTPEARARRQAWLSS